MALATHQLQSSCSSFPSLPSSWSRGSKLKHFVSTRLEVGQKYRFSSLKCKSCFSIGAPLVLGPKSKVFKVSAFRGSTRHDESDSRASGSKSPKNPVKVSYVQQSEESSLEPSKVQNIVPVPYTSTADEKTARLLAIQTLFKNWLLLLRTPSRNQPVDEVLEEPSLAETSEKQNAVQKQERGGILKAIWCYFLGLDVTIKLTLLIFVPLYLAINLAYGAEVSKELTPLWVIGPLVVALYIKMFQAICGLYVFSFKQTVKVIKNLPKYFLVAYNYLVLGKLKEDILARTWKPLVDIKNMDYKEVTRRKLKDLGGWLMEKYLDYVESIWPFYCRMIRFLKRANLI
ncbi:embryo defective [Abeliophyllum distichum]|uniref:Embryo defective n=1 Tax=Abeliophyllum distichum TaxID=126358 RepID=A0ABD1RX72_9LAMI